MVGVHARWYVADGKPVAAQRAIIVEEAVNTQAETALVADVKRAVQGKVAAHVEQGVAWRSAQLDINDAGGIHFYIAVDPQRLALRAGQHPVAGKIAVAGDCTGPGYDARRPRLDIAVECSVNDKRTARPRGRTAQGIVHNQCSARHYCGAGKTGTIAGQRSEEHTSELQSLMRN